MSIPWNLYGGEGEDYELSNGDVRITMSKKESLKLGATIIERLGRSTANVNTTPAPARTRGATKSKVGRKSAGRTCR